jgi:hypothetical protein
MLLLGTSGGLKERLEKAWEIHVTLLGQDPSRDSNTPLFCTVY